MAMGQLATERETFEIAAGNGDGEMDIDASMLTYDEMMAEALTETLGAVTVEGAYPRFTVNGEDATQEQVDTIQAIAERIWERGEFWVEA